ncbi:VWA domain-containing protein [Bryocella elongata]|uniref:VWA domain-containing protein n=1 Tax=Bryocella elongata TaxID=863522 RepID=UPI0013593AD8|nr:VWA domain-containing protein [Bryocella elongata]
MLSPYRLEAAARMFALPRLDSLKLTLPSCCLWLLTTSLAAQSTPSQTPSPATPTIRTGTQLVIVDVSVSDHNGNPVHGLKQGDLILTEDKTPQDVRHFEEHSASDKPAGPQMPAMPPGMFTNYTAVPADSTLNVLLIDTLNTPMKDQSFLRDQLTQYVKKAAPGTHIAIFGMSTRLYLLQGFTADPEMLKDAVEHKLIPRASSLLDDPVGTGADATNMSDIASDSGAPTEVVANLQQFEAEQESVQTQFRVRFTLDAFNALAHYLQGFPGRKNLIWFSGSFPLSLSPNPDISDPFAVIADMEEEFRETTNLLTRAQVSVFPVDARGLMTLPSMSAANSGSKYVTNPKAFGADIQKFSQSQFDEHSTMDQMADATGGKAFYNTNGLSDATAKAIESGSNYYTLTYSPSNHEWNGKYRSIKVALSDAARAQGLTLTYRRGYYALSPDNAKKPEQSAVVSEAVAAAPGSASNYARLAMQRGAPTPHDILIKVRVLPVSDKPDDTLATGNVVNPAKPLKPPYRRYQVDLVALTQDFAFTKNADGTIGDTIEVKLNLYDTDGNLLNVAGQTAQIKLPADKFKLLLQNGLQYHTQLSTPAKGETFLRIGVHDLSSNRFGVVEIPTSRISHLPPAPAAPPPPASNPAPPKP